MIVGIFDTYDDNTKELIRSLDFAKIPSKKLFVRYFGDLPEDALCPFTYFATQLKKGGKGRFFNQVPVPNFYEIRNETGINGLIFKGDQIVGRIDYRKGTFRKVEKVAWFDNLMNLVKEDLYDTAGTHFASNYYSGGKLYQTAYRKNQEEVIWENHLNQTVTLKEEDKYQQFNTLTEFFIYFLQEIGVTKDENFIYNSLSYPLFALRDYLENPSATLFWQEPMESIPGNMIDEISAPKSTAKIVFKDQEQLERVQNAYPQAFQEFHYLSAIGQFTRRNLHRLRTFTLTASDQLFGIEELLNAHPDIHFTIAAKTSMSNHLLKLGGLYENVELLPTINDKRLASELEQADIYLDINQSGEVENIVDKAYEQSMLIFAQRRLVKKPNKAIIFDTLEQLQDILNDLKTRENAWDESLQFFHEEKGKLSNVEDYQQLFLGE